jgi:multiple sugar transport system ATP-binding protein
MNFFKDSTLTSSKGKVYVNFVGNNKIVLPKAVATRIKNIEEYLDTGKKVTLGVRPEDIHQDQMFISNSPETVVKARIEVIEKLGAETQIYCELDHEDKESSVIDNSTQMIAKISSRAIVALKDIIELAFDAKHIHMFDAETEATLLEREAGYETIEESDGKKSYVA